MEINSAGMGGFDKLIQGAAGDVQAGKNEMSTAFDEYSKAEDKTLAMINLQAVEYLQEFYGYAQIPGTKGLRRSYAAR